MAIEVIRVVVVVFLEGQDSNHITFSTVPKDKDWLLVGPEYHALHHMYPDQFMSSLFRLFDWIMGTSSTLKNKRVAISGARGAFGAALKRQLESDGVSVITALQYKVDFDDESVSTGGIQALTNTDILILAHGLRYGDVMKANYETSRRLVEVFAQARKSRAGRRPTELPEVWYTGSESEMHPNWGNESLAAYSASKRRFLSFAKSLYESETVVYRHIVLAAFSSKMGPAIVSADWAARCTMWWIRRGFQYVPVTYTGIAYVHFFNFLFGIKAEVDGLRRKHGDSGRLPAQTRGQTIPRPGAASRPIVASAPTSSPSPASACLSISSARHQHQRAPVAVLSLPNPTSSPPQEPRSKPHERNEDGHAVSLVTTTPEVSRRMPNSPIAAAPTASDHLDTHHHTSTEDKKRSHPDPHHFRPPPPPLRLPTSSQPSDEPSSIPLPPPPRPPVFQSVSSDAIDAPPLRKKPRLLPRHERFTFSGPSINRLQPPSPLFFSNSPRPRPHLPPRFTSFEAGATMLSKANNEDSHVKTVTLARGTVSNSLRRSIDRSSTGRSASPDLRGELSLNSIGILELLDHDDRPAMIVDLADGTNNTEASLRPVFTNRSLRSCPDLINSLTGIARDQDEAAFAQFKAWALGSQVAGGPLSVPLPTHVYAGTSWSFSTLRKRLRIISGASATVISNGALATSISRQSSNSTSTSAMSISQPSSSLPISSSALPATLEEPDDYFGSAAPAPTSIPASVDVSSSIIPSTEAVDDKARPTSSPSLSYDSRKISPLSIRDPTLLDTHPSFVNEQVLCAQTAGNIDWFDSSSAGFCQEGPSFDWTRLPISDSMPPHIKFARSIEWEKTPLGSIEGWSSDLRQMCNLIMASPHPAAMYWGQELVAIYNEAYVMLAGQKHPALMGQRYSDAWSEIWPDVKDVFSNALHTGEATMKDDDRLFIVRNDYLEETYFSWSIIPMVGGDGSVMGLYNPAFEKTRRKLAERRMITLREIGERTAPARDIKGFWGQVLAALDLNEHDTPFVMLYSVQDETDSDASSIHSNSVMANRQCVLEGALGVPEDHPAAVSCFDLKTGMEGLGPVFREVMKTDKPVLLEVGTKDLPSKLLEGLGGRGFADSCRNVVICPIHPTTGEAVLGFLVMGVNPRRPYDEDYSLFIQLLNRQLATSLASVVLFEEEIRRGQKAAKLAAIDRMELSEQLAARTQEAIESETKFTRMAEFAPVGMFIADSEGTITYCNDTWFEISRVSRDENTPDHHWMDAVNDEDRELINKLWHDLIVEKKPQTGTFRFKSKWHGSEGLEGDRWVLFSAYPEKYEDGKLKSVFGSLTDISKQKWAEGFQKRKMEEAVELKRQQENFIDITSHEMRNPLSAILQCADEITTTMSRLRDGLSGQASLVKPIDKFLEEGRNVDETVDGILSSTVDSAQTIALCAQHQKRIVDDILTLSKLDSQLLLVTPVDAQPLTVAQRALKMHEGELQTADIQLRFVVDDSYKKLGIDWVKFDPSRVLQVLINLTTNAIKFTTTEKKRTITVTLAASTKRFSELESRVVNYFPTRNKHSDLTKEKDWGDGEEVYIHFAVQDTGRGLNEQEKKMLFLRFSQASPRTHVQYGGSGLGLFISRELTELQGGEIGVASEFGVGSTFAFWVKAKRSSAPPEAEGLNRPATRAASDATGKKVPTVVNAKAEGAIARPIKVLIVEDNIVNARVLSKQLKNLGCVVHVANHGGEALDILRKSTYWNHKADDERVTPESERIGLSVVLMDQEMPIMDGLTCTRKIREFEKEGKFVRHVPVIAVTANARSEQIETAMSAGMDDVMPKPFRIPELIPKIEELMAKYPEV
ncbi:hypothetical protein E4T48_08562 [Aureobasidium sp. EXF-10727]|nr:hypothetical protein E4T48_08562 [Aureobasidium sp. EXF-10727]